MKVTAQVELALKSGKTLAYASIMLDDLLVIDGFKVVQGEKEIFVSGPALNTKIGRAKTSTRIFADIQSPNLKIRSNGLSLQPIVCPRLKSNIAM